MTKRKPTSDNPFDPDTMSSSLAVRPADVRAHVEAERKRMAAPKCETFAIGYDAAAGEDMTACVVLELQPDGRHRVVSVRTWTPTGEPIMYELVVCGWKCRECFVFCSEEKELMVRCRACDAPRPTLAP